MGVGGAYSTVLRAIGFKGRYSSLYVVQTLQSVRYEQESAIKVVIGSHTQVIFKFYKLTILH